MTSQAGQMPGSFISPTGCFGSEWVITPQYAGEIWKCSFHSENASTVFLSQCAGLTILDLCLRKIRAGKSHHDYYDVAPFWNCFPSTQTQNRRFQIPEVSRFQDCLEKAPFLRLGCRNKAAFSNFFSRVCTGPQKLARAGAPDGGIAHSP